MKRLVCVLAALLAVTLLASAAGIDGKYTFEQAMRGKKGGEGEARKVATTLNLKSEGATLTGTVTTSNNGRERSVDVKDGKIDGDKFSFTTMQRSQQGEMKVTWEGTVKGDELTGERKMEGRNRGMPFTAKKQ